ncbi:hypothetical protein [Clostridium merdae]|uniref:hypothetical protein n=1 Tax=Clostridium merdae TaxID=1958780 RepID=UPI000A272239|nr:hypothetical protein [Clostridium merdae]
MPSTNKTPKLGLNSWVESDKPRREDFVQDNTILDTILSEHFADVVQHLTTVDRQKLNEGVVVGSRTGTGTEEASISLDFEPKLFLLFAKDKAITESNFSSSYTVVNSGVATQWGSTAGLAMSGKKVTVKQSKNAPEAGGAQMNLNKLYGQYIYIAVR